jgi:hypothetical protein
MKSHKPLKPGKFCLADDQLNIDGYKLARVDCHRKILLNS